MASQTNLPPPSSVPPSGQNVFQPPSGLIPLQVKISLLFFKLSYLVLALFMFTNRVNTIVNLKLDQVN